MNSPELTQTGSMNSATNSVPEIVGGGLSPRQLQIEQTGAGSTVKYHGMYVAKDAVAQLAGTLPQRAVVPCFVRGARLRVCVRVSALRVCVCVAVWEGSVAVRVVCRVLRPLRTPGRPRAGAVARVPFGRCHIHALRATWTSASRLEVREAGACACGCARYIVFLYACFMCVY